MVFVTEIRIFTHTAEFISNNLWRNLTMVIRDYATFRATDKFSVTTSVDYPLLSFIFLTKVYLQANFHTKLHSLQTIFPRNFR